MTVLATWSLWADLVKDGNSYILTETGASVWPLCRERATLLADAPEAGRDLRIVRNFLGSRFTAPQEEPSGKEHQPHRLFTLIVLGDCAWLIR